MAPQRRQPKRRTPIDPRKLYIIRQGVFGVLILLFIGAVVTGIWHGSRLEALTIDTVTVVGGVTIDKDDVKEAVEAELTGTYYRLVPKRFAWTYPEAAIKRAVSDIERLKEVRLERVNGTTLAVAFDEYIPYALWCTAKESEDCFFIDQTGYAFGPSPRLTGGSFVRYITLHTKPEQGGSVAPRGDLLKTEQFIELLKEQLGFYVTVVELDAVGDVFYTLARGGELKATRADDPQGVIENLAVILGSDAFSHLRPGEFAYIDLRFGDKVYVNEEGIPDTASSSVEAEIIEPVE